MDYLKCTRLELLLAMISSVYHTSSDLTQFVYAIRKINFDHKLLSFIDIPPVEIVSSICLSMETELNSIGILTGNS